LPSCDCLKRRLPVDAGQRQLNKDAYIFIAEVHDGHMSSKYCIYSLPLYEDKLHHPKLLMKYNYENRISRLREISMNYYLRKILSLFVVLFVISLLTFAAFQILPGDPVKVILGTDATPERVQQLTHQLSLDKPLWMRYILWLGGATHGDFGTSIKYQLPITEILASRLPVTVWLSVLSLFFILIFSIPLGILAAAKHNKLLDKIIIGLSNVFTAIPPFFLSILITLVFGLMLKWFQAGAFVPMEEDFGGFIKYLMVPAIAIALPNSAVIIKFLRASASEQLKADYVRTARSKGCKESRIMIFHVFKNAMITVATLLGMIIADILSGSIVVEQVFSIPGLGRLIISSIGARDFPLLETLVLFIASIVVVVNFLVDVSFKVIDPRLRIH